VDADQVLCCVGLGMAVGCEWSRIREVTGAVLV
jgi:hypothetical protein